MIPDRKIAKNFSLYEFFVSKQYPDLAIRQLAEIDNSGLTNLIYLADAEQRVRDKLNEVCSDKNDIKIINTSAVRFKALNDKVGGSPKTGDSRGSCHLYCEAVDFTLEEKKDRLQIAFEFIKDNILYSELVLYKDKSGHPLFIHFAKATWGKAQYSNDNEVRYG